MNSIRSALTNPWRQMIVVSAASMVVLFVYKAAFATPDLQYVQLIVDYHFGFSKRASVGTLIGLVLPVVPVWLVFALGIAIWAIVLLLFVVLFRRTFGLGPATMPLFVFMFSSPFFLKNFLQTLGYFDIYGCAWALVMLLIPARSFAYVAIGGVGCAVLVLMHPIHFLLYVPTIGVIVTLRYYCTRCVTAAEIAGGLAMAVPVGVIFVAGTAFGAMKVPVDELIAYVRSRAATPELVTPVSLRLYYLTIADDMAGVRNVFFNHSLRFPIYVGLIALHWPLIRYFNGLIRALTNVWHRRLTVLGIVGVALAQAIIGSVNWDYPRYFSAWVVGMILILHAVRELPAGTDVPHIADDRLNRTLGWLITAVPRIGTTKIF